MERTWVGLLLLTLHLLCCCHGAAALSQSDTECLNQKCGNVRVSYPFKLDDMDNCPSFSPSFSLHCKQGELYLTNMSYNDASVDMRILHFDTNNLTLDATGFGSSPMNDSCLSPTSTFSSLILPTSFPFPSPFVISDDNLFGSFGCFTGIFIGIDSTSETDLRSVVLGGCSVLCRDDKYPDCEGHTCCVSSRGQGASIREVVYYVNPSPFIRNDTSPDVNTECHTMYAIIFHRNYSDFSKKTYGIKLNGHCHQTKLNPFQISRELLTLHAQITPTSL
ncbi:hypothetical protein L7F22_009698 [Adiantum nelumboides]|nr:hypothetical protein [Adiantum nelumboides]